MQIAYLFFTSLFLIPWIILFILRKDIRKEMLWASIITAIGGLFCEKYWYTADWVNPTTITNTTVGIEDLLMGFGVGGIGAVIYKEVLKRDEYKPKVYKYHWLFILPIIFGFFIADVMFRQFGLFSFYSNVIGFSFIFCLIFLFRKDLLQEGLIGGVSLVIVTLPIYWITFKFFPEWRFQYWRELNISGADFLGIPYEDLIWWFIVGVNLAIVYDFNYGLKLRKLPRRA